jgi:hypothetical protein
LSTAKFKSSPNLCYKTATQNRVRGAQVADDAVTRQGRQGPQGPRGEPGVPDRRVIPDGPDWKVLAENRVWTASPVRKARLVRKVRAAKPALKASLVRGAKPVRAAKPDRPANCLRSNR